ncbi:hypothetical protein ZYGR_0AD03820 [Zygosaccharomyces rouxii]|uniref:RNA helicase n=1 Tax=Zygosaccharomyces rouxii TaxID=4956 RepID=A0A1Q3A661_ZYGRO|nr:hypothetical protein ZYGR_0AD03820 [Zygosaccharomyces rouxii]
MSSVSANDNNNAKLLQERREKLAKWKKQKALRDEQKKKHTNTENSSEKLTESQQELQQSKKKKRKNDQADSTFRKTVKSSKNRSTKKISFDESDEEGSTQGIELFKPMNNDVVDVNNSEAKDDVDPLEKYIQSLSSNDDGNLVPPSVNLMDADDNEVPSDEKEMSSDEDEEGFKFAKIAKMKSKKQVKEIRYERNELESFRKDFYSQLPQALLSDNEISELRLNLGNIKVRGDGCPLPITRWSQLGLTSDITSVLINDLKFENPTSIQAQAIPAIMCGRDVIGISKTGSGKTISYLLPLIRHIKAQRHLASDESGPLGLVLAPTRELAIQINEEVTKFTAKDKSVNSVCCTGGSELKEQIRKLKKGIEIVVATPGRFIDLLTLNTGKLLSTRRITFVIMDEADRLFDMGFEPQITQIMKTIRPDKQCVLFSATFPNKLRNFAMRVLHRPLSITINSKSLVNENVTQRFDIANSDEEKFNTLLRILEKHEESSNGVPMQQDWNDSENKDEKAIIFVSSQQICDLLHIKLENEGYTIYSIHAGKPYQERLNNLENFKSTPNSILLCTEVLSRGLNVPEVSLVLIYNAVKTFAQYVHTTGRTARGTHTGVAMTLLLNDEIAGAFILNKAIRDKELEEHDPRIVKQLKSMSQEFEKGMQSGKFKVSQGFGGKGLDNLESKREERQSQEKKYYENDEKLPLDNEPNVKNTKDASSSTQIQVPKLRYRVLNHISPEGDTVFIANVNVNDLPQIVRWEVTKNTTLMFVKNETGCSITNKGKYYPEGQGPKSDRDEPKLYLLIESDNEKDIKLCIDLLEGKAKEGVRKVGIQSIKDTKY